MTILKVFSKVLITTSAYNRPEFIELQYKTFKKFIKDDYEYIVFNDADIEDNRIKIESECKRYGIKHIRIPQEIHKVENNTGLFNPYNGTRAIRTVFRQGDVLTYMFNFFKHTAHLVMIIDSDVFLIRPLNVVQYCTGYDITALCGKSHPLFITSPWPPELAIFDMAKLPDKNSIILKPGFIGTDFLDPYEFLQFYVDSHKDLLLKCIKDGYQRTFNYLAKNYSKGQLNEQGYLQHEIEFIFSYYDLFKKHNCLSIVDYGCFYGENREFFNFNHGSNWTNLSLNLFNDKLKLFIGFVSEIIEYSDKKFEYIK